MELSCGHNDGGEIVIVSIQADLEGCTPYNNRFPDDIFSQYNSFAS